VGKFMPGPGTVVVDEDLAAVLSDPMAIGERLAERERTYPLRRGSAAHLPGSDVSVDNEASETATVLEVRAPDAIGLLHRITRALFEANLDVASARVSTLGEMVVACIVAEVGVSLDEEAVRAFVAKRLSSYKVPRRVLFMQEGDLTMTGSSKVKLAPLRELAARRLQ